MIDLFLLRYYWTRAVVGRIVRDERGEGVISAAIAVLIMAAVGALMWVGIKQLWGNASSQTNSQISKIGQ